MKNKKLLFIVNPRSGRNKFNDDLLEVTNIFGKKGYEMTVMTTEKSGDATEFAKRYGADYGMVVCRGGDGTFCETLNGLMTLETRPTVGFIPAGTTNDLANTLGLPTKPRQAAQMIVSENPLPNDLGEMNGRYFTYVASFGALTKCSYATSQSLKNKIGRLAYFYEGAKEVKDIKPIPMRIVCDGTVIEDEIIFGAVSNSYTVGKIIHLDRDMVVLNDGLFEAVFAFNPGNFGNFLKMFTGAMKSEFDEKYIKILQGKHIEIKTLDGSALPWTLDGEFGGNHSEVVIDVHEKAFKMYRPPLKHEMLDPVTK